MAVTYDFQTPGVSTSAADTQEDIRNIAEAAATGFNSSHTLSNIPTGAWRMEGIGYSNQANFQYYNGSSWDDMKFSKIHLNNNGLVLVNEIGVHTLEFIAMGDTPGYVTTGASSWFIQSDFLSVGTSTFDPILGFMNQGTERARIYTDTSDSHKLKFDVGGSDQMVIDSSGIVNLSNKFRIGSGTPSYDFEISKSNDSNPVGSIQNLHATGYSGFEFYDSGSTADLYFGLERNDTNGTRLNYINGDFTVYANGTQTATFDSSGKVGIGTSSPSRQLDIENISSNPFVSLVTSTTRDAGIFFGDTDSDSRGRVYYQNSVDDMSFYTAGTEKVRISSSGNVEVNTGNLVIGTSGKGIDFSATSGTGTSELLDDYEEGTFTPTFEPDSGSFTSITYNRRTGNYTKIGNTVHCWIDISTNELTVGSASGNIHISGLPFTITAHSTALVGAQSGWITKAPDHAAVQSGQTKISLRWLDQSTQNYQNITVSNLKTGTNSDANRLIGISFSYKTS